MESKHCRKCDTSKQTTEFFKNSYTANGRSSWCKQCESDYRKLRYDSRKSMPVTITESVCTKCKQTLPVSQFRKNADKINGVDVHCNDCSRDALRTPAGKKRRMCYTAKQRAKTLNVPFNISPVDFDMPTRCPVLGLELCMTHPPGGPKDDAPSLDRIIPNLGYVKGNVMVISQRANRIKNDSSIEELKKVVDFLTRIQEGVNVSS